MTKQRSDNIQYDGIVGHIEEAPLEVYLKLNGLNLQYAGGEFSTALWRGYIADWVIEGGQLFLVGLSDAGFNEIDFSVLGELATKRETGRVLAEWYSGQLTCPRGDVKERHSYVDDVYEFDDLFEVENGRVISFTTRKNTHGRPQVDMSAFADATCSACGFAKRLPRPEGVPHNFAHQCWPVWCRSCGALSISDYPKPQLSCGECGSKRVSTPDRNRLLTTNETELSRWERARNYLSKQTANILGRAFTGGRPFPAEHFVWSSVGFSREIYLCPNCSEFHLKFSLPYTRKRFC